MVLRMPRRGRLHIPGGCYHVIGRGLERRFIFEGTANKRDFLSRFGNNLIRNDAQCLSLGANVQSLPFSYSCRRMAAVEMDFKTKEDLSTEQLG